MKLQAASKKEISRIAVGTLVCDVIMIAGLFLLSQFGIGKFYILRIYFSNILYLSCHLYYLSFSNCLY